MKSKTEIRKPTIYIASPYNRITQLGLIERIEQALEDNPFVAGYYSPRLNQMDGLAFGTEVWRSAVFENDTTFLQQSDVVIAVADMDGEDVHSGTAFEVGLAYALGKPVILVMEEKKPLDVKLANSLFYFTESADSLADYNFLKLPQGKYSGAVK